jgi:hypothetical protein
LETNCDDWYEVNCRHCKYSQYTETFQNKKSIIQSECKRIDHNHIRFANPCFIGHACGGNLSRCGSDFEPSPGLPWLYNHWDKIDIMLPKENAVIPFTLDRDTSIWYYVKYLDFYNNTFLNPDGTLKWAYKMYYKKARNILGYGLMREYADGKVFKNGKQPSGYMSVR